MIILIVKFIVLSYISAAFTSIVNIVNIYSDVKLVIPQKLKKLSRILFVINLLTAATNIISKIQFLINSLVSPLSLSQYSNNINIVFFNSSYIKVAFLKFI